jgi:transposase
VTGAGSPPQGKSDPIDALAVARAALREPGLPAAELDGPSRELCLLVDHREDLVAERTRIQNRLRWHLHELAPGTEPAGRTLGRRKLLEALEIQLASYAGVVAEIARELVDDVRRLTERIDQLEREIRARTAQLAPSLLALPGCAALTAAKLVGEVGRVSRFKSRAAFAMHNGTAPIPVWSGRADRFRLNRGGNRQLNVALHRIAITQMRLDGAGKALDLVGNPAPEGPDGLSLGVAVGDAFGDVTVGCGRTNPPSQLALGRPLDIGDSDASTHFRPAPWRSCRLSITA